MVPRGLKAIQQLNGEEGQAHGQILRLPPVGQVEFPPLPEYPKDFSKGLPLVFPSQMMEQKARKDPVKNSICEGQFMGQPAIPENLRPGPGGFVSSHPQDFPVSVQARHWALGKLFLDPQSEGSRPAAQVEHPMGNAQTCLLNKGRFEC